MTEKDFEEQDKKIRFVCDNTSSISRLVQLGEECAEFIQALHKYLRKQLDDNPTPKTEDEILANIKEELMDIQLSLDCISADLIDYDIYQKKLNRWVSRLMVDMKPQEKKSTKLLNSTTELRQLILNNPNLPLLVFAGEDCNGGYYGYVGCSYVRAYKGEFLDCQQAINDEKYYIKRDDFSEDLADKLYSEWKELGSNTDQKFEEFFKKRLLEYDPYWKDCIILLVDS